jgi:hemolysin activation/secretion protein
MPFTFAARSIAQLAWISSALVLSQAAHAAPADPAQQVEQLQQRQQEQLQRDLENARRAVRPGGADLRAPEPTTQAAPAGPATCHDIKTIVIRNGPRLRAAMRSQIDSSFAGHCLGVNEITEILGLITKDYVEQGYITTRAYLPSQDLRQGTLTIDVVEGVIEKFKIDDNGAGKLPVGAAFPGLQGQVLNLRDLEQGIDQINRLQSNNAKLDIEPGSVPGGSTVVVRNQQTRPVHLFVSYDDQGQEGTGANQVSATVVMDDLAGLGDMLSFTHRQSMPLSDREHYTQSDGIDLSVPHGYDTWSLSAIRSRYINLITLPSGTALPADGSNEIGTFGWSRVMFRDQASRFTVGAALSAKDARNFFAGQYLDVSSRRLSLLDLRTGYSRVLAGGGLLQLGADYIRGLDALGALHDPDLLPGDQPHAQFGKMTMDAQLSLPFKAAGRRWSYDSQLSAQQAQDPLYGSEKLLIGSLYSVRGFYNDSLSGDRGYYWRNALSTTQAFQVGAQSLSTREYAALDVGRVSNINADLQGGHLAGAAVGVQAQWHGLTWDLFRTKPISRPDGLNNDSAHTWFRVAAAL